MPVLKKKTQNIVLDEWQKKILEEKGDICLCSGRQVGKSQIIGIKAAEHAINNPNNVVIIGAALARQASHIFWMVKDYLFENYPKQIKGRPTLAYLELKNGSQIRCLPVGDDGLGIRGFTAHVLIIDEAAFVNPKAWSGIRPVLATTKGQLILLSTPFGTEGYFADCFKNPRFYKDHVSSEDCPRITKEFLAEEKRTMTKLQYQQEYLGLFVGGIQRFFPDELIDKVCTIPPNETQAPKYDRFQGIDIARMGGDETVLVSVSRINRNRLMQINMEIPEGQKLTDTARLIIHKDKTLNHKKIYIDTGGLGIGVYDILFEDNQTKRKVVEINNAKRIYEIDRTGKINKEKTAPLFKELLYLNLKNLMEAGNITLFNSPEVRQSLRSIQYENQGEILKIYGNYSHIVEALIRAVWCVKDKSLNILAFCK